VQNSIMTLVVLLLVGLLAWGALRRNLRHILAVVAWTLIALWFFNSPLWGFSAVTVGSDGLQLHYGFLSVFRNTRLPPDTPWKIHAYLGDLRKTKKLYFFQVAEHRSLKIRGADQLETLQAIGTAIDRLNDRPMGGMEQRPINQ